MTTIYPPATIQAAFRQFAESVGARCSGIADAGLPHGRQYSLNWNETLGRWFVLAYEFDVGSWEVLSMIGRDACLPA